MPRVPQSVRGRSSFQKPEAGWVGPSRPWAGTSVGWSQWVMCLFGGELLRIVVFVSLLFPRTSGFRSCSAPRNSWPVDLRG